jgi:hypothetical protein
METRTNQKWTIILNKFALYTIVDLKFLFNLDKGHHGS